ncbi:MAG: TIGR04283 family arsenosugar biosynthesis glycosyltransferase [Beijerinckiaceae bacterium]
MAGQISIIVPVLNEQAGMAATLDALASAGSAGVEIIVADGGSSDSTVSEALPRCDLVVTAPRGRASQMNAGAAAATGEILLFLHADTRLPEHWSAAVRTGLADRRHGWGRFDVRIEGKSPMLRIVGAMMNLRSRLTGIATGDQAIFMRRAAFDKAGGFPDIPLMEDIAMSKRLKRESPPLCLRQRVVTSGRRWEKNGVWRTIFAMWRLRFSYWLGADPAELARQYGYRPREDKA